MPAESARQSLEQGRQAAGLHHNRLQPGHKDTPFDTHPADVQAVQLVVRAVTEAALHPGLGNIDDPVVGGQIAGYPAPACGCAKDCVFDKGQAGGDVEICVEDKQGQAVGISGGGRSQGQPDHVSGLFRRLRLHLQVRTVGQCLHRAHYVRLREAVRDHLRGS